jgi:hypothetical protein
MTTVGISGTLEQRPMEDLHPAQRRRLVIVLRGGFEVDTTTGERRQFGPGCCLVVDDLNSRDRAFEDIGEDRLICITGGIDPDWECP